MRVLITLSALMLAVSSPSQANAADHSPDEARAWADQFYGDYIVGEMDFQTMLDTYYAEDVDFADPTFGFVVKGHAAVTEAFGSVATENSQFQNIAWQIDHVFSKGNDINVIGRWKGTWYDCPFDVQFSSLFTLQNGKIAKQLDLFGVDDFYKQVKLDRDRGVPTCEQSSAATE